MKLFSALITCYVYLHVSCVASGDVWAPQTSKEAFGELRRIIVKLIMLDVQEGNPPEDLRSAVVAKFSSKYTRTELESFLSTMEGFRHERCRIRIVKGEKIQYMLDFVYKHRRADGTLGAVGAYIGFTIDPRSGEVRAGYVEYGVNANLNP